VSGVVPPARNQIAIEPAIEAKPRKKQTLLSDLSGFDFIHPHYHRSFFNQGVKFGIFDFIPRAGQRKQLIAMNLLFGLMCMDRKRRGSKGWEKGSLDKADRLKAEILK
jgi:hypothetical protein